MTDYITILQRRSIFRATCELLRILQRNVNRRCNENLTHGLLKRLTKVAMDCPGFTPLMKDDIAYISHMGEEDQMGYGQPPFANAWRHQYALGPKPGFPNDLLEVSDDS